MKIIEQEFSNQELSMKVFLTRHYRPRVDSKRGEREREKDGGSACGVVMCMHAHYIPTSTWYPNLRPK